MMKLWHCAGAIQSNSQCFKMLNSSVLGISCLLHFFQVGGLLFFARATSTMTVIFCRLGLHCF
jgi:hypothetical protein